MLSINTNLSSLIAQQSMSSATNKLNQAIERMTTGYKINGAKDNAANYSISQNMQTQLGSYDVAADNVAMGMDLVTTASDIINNMQDKATRLQALCTQARNGTYGAQSLAAINTEAGAIMAEIMRLYSTAEYNQVSLFNREAYTIADHLPKAGKSGFIDESVIDLEGMKVRDDDFIADPKTYTDEQVAAMVRVKDVSTFTSGQKYAIYTKEELIKLADYVNAGNDTAGAEFVLGSDIDLSSISNWTPIGYDYGYSFKGYFNGNGYVIKNLKIENSGANNQGLFGYVLVGSEIKNIGLIDVQIKGGEYTGALIGEVYDPILIENCYVTGNIEGKNSVGGLVGYANMCGSMTIKNSYSDVNVTGVDYVGGLIGNSIGQSIINSYTEGVITGNDFVGGLVGTETFYSDEISNVYSTATVIGNNNVGGLFSIAGYVYLGFNNAYFAGSVKGNENVGGIAGKGDTLNFNNVFSLGTVAGTTNVGGLVGQFYDGANGSSHISNCYTTSEVIGEKRVGGMVGVISLGGNSLTDCYSYATVKGEEGCGSLVGGVSDETQTFAGCSAITSGKETIGAYYSYDYVDFSINTTYDLSGLRSAIQLLPNAITATTLQVGIKSDSSCQITFDTNFKFDLSVIEGNIASDEALAAINDFTNLLSEKSTQLGAVQNRLDSALESITVNMENLTSSLSTIRDADIAEVSSLYIQQQILQQASATLLATANQSPSIALQLI